MLILVISIAFATLRLFVGLGGKRSNIIGICLTNSDITLSATGIICAPIFIRVWYFDTEKFTSVLPQLFAIG